MQPEKIAMAVSDEMKVETLLKAVRAMPLSATLLTAEDYPKEQCVTLTLELMGEGRKESVTVLYKTIYGLSSNIEIDDFVSKKQSYLLDRIIHKMQNPSSMDN